MLKNVMFIHVYTINNYQTILEEILNSVDKNIDEIIICKIGDLEIKNYKGTVINISDNYNFCENETINYIRRFCKDNNVNVLYTHTKGVCHPNNKAVEAWRKYMIHFNIEKSQECINSLEDFDVCGVDFRINPVPHFCGNFWWSKSSHINKLPDPNNANTIISHRHKAEFWICNYDPTIKFKSFHQNDLNKLHETIFW